MTITSGPRIVVVGGGAGGLELVSRLGERFGRYGRADITLIDAELTHLWKPLLHEVAAGTMDSHEDDLEYLAQARRRHFTFRLGRMTGLDRARKLVHVASTLDEAGQVIVPARSIPYDVLVLAIGSVSNDFGIAGVQEHCAFLDTRAQGDRFQRRLLQSFLRAQTSGTVAPTGPGRLAIAIVGAGATGVELAAELHHVARQSVAYGLDLAIMEREARFVIVEAAARILPALPETLATAAQTELEHLNIVVHVGKRVTRVTADGLHTDDGLFIPSAMTVWAAGIKAPDLLRDLDGLEANRSNQLVVRQTLQTTRDNDIYAIGDCACYVPPDGERAVPPTAQVAHQQASLVARSIARRLRDRSLPRFRYRDRGALVSMAGYATVGNLMGRLLGNVRVEGFIARLMYRLLYRLHQQALFGTTRTVLLVIADLLTRPVRPRMKLH